MDQNNASGAGFLKVTGILMIVFGALGAFGSVIGLLGASALLLLSLGTINPGLLYGSLLLGIVGSVIQIIAGVNGVTHCNDPSKADTCVMWGGIVAGLAVLSSILNVVSGNKFSFLGLLIGLVIPVLFIVGALKNKGTI